MVGTKIKHIRETLRLSQEELGHMVGINQTLISRIERNTRKVTVSELATFSKALGVTVYELLDELG